jgi:hypothetical protein
MATDYTSLITSLHADKPNFVATVAALTKPFGDITDSIQGLTVAFDIDSAVGVQLDVIGLWVGVPRNQLVPVANSYFTWNLAGLGWNQGSWKGPYSPTEGITTLDDDTYRVVLKAQAASNYWNGANDTLNVIGETVVSSVGVQCFVIDNMDMTCTVYILGAPTPVLIAMIQRGFVPPKTAGVRITGYILASDPGAPFFALDVYTTTEVAGLDFGSFGDPLP